MGLPDAPKPTTLREIAGAWLVANGYDGLYSDAGGCACSTDDLMPCDEPGTRCKPGYKIPCVCGEGCDFDISATPAPGEAETVGEITMYCAGCIDLRRQLAEAKDARIIAEREAGDLRAEVARKKRVNDDLVELLTGWRKDAGEMGAERDAAMAEVEKMRAEREADERARHDALSGKCGPSCFACRLNRAEAEVARLTPKWTDGPPDRVGSWLREHDGGRYAINVVDRDLTPPRIWDLSRWLYLGDIVERGKP